MSKQVNWRPSCLNYSIEKPTVGTTSVVAVLLGFRWLTMVDLPELSSPTCPKEEGRPQHSSCLARGDSASKGLSAHAKDSGL